MKKLNTIYHIINYFLYLMFLKCITILVKMVYILLQCWSIKIHYHSIIFYFFVFKFQIIKNAYDIIWIFFLLLFFFFFFIKLLFKGLIYIKFFFYRIARYLCSKELIILNILDKPNRSISSRTKVLFYFICIRYVSIYVCKREKSLWHIFRKFLNKRNYYIWRLVLSL